MPRPYAMVPVKAARADLGAAACVYIALCAFAGDRTGECFPSQRRIAEMTGLRRNQVQQQIAKLARLGLIKVRRQHRADGGKTANRYQIVLDHPSGLGGTHPSDLGGTHPSDLGDQREPEKDSTIQFEEEGCAADGRSAPLHSTDERGPLPQAHRQASVRDRKAYDAEVRDRKRHNWLQTLYGWVSYHLHGDERWRAWEAIEEARGGRETTPKISTRLLDELDRRRRSERTGASVGKG
jgi:hypothetical protein